ncbi:hypothetical protein ASG25_09310 [Rhizobium sp. Leaf384]|nr:hypothetical protein ASG25_09310 [Rhizobium sp. Leaf384]
MAVRDAMFVFERRLPVSTGAGDLVYIPTGEAVTIATEGEAALTAYVTALMLELMAQGYRINHRGTEDRTSDRRSLVRTKLSDIRRAGRVVVSAGHAQSWPNA